MLLLAACVIMSPLFQLNTEYTMDIILLTRVQGEKVSYNQIGWFLVPLATTFNNLYHLCLVTAKIPKQSFVSKSSSDILFAGW